MQLLPATQHTLDELQGEFLCLTLFADERPLQGMASLVDWRVDGAMSRSLLGRRVLGHRGERVLFCHPRFSSGVLLTGLGARELLNETAFAESCRSIVDGASKLAVPGVTIELSCRVVNALGVERVFGILSDTLRQGHQRLSAKVLIDAQFMEAARQALIHITRSQNV